MRHRLIIVNAVLFVVIVMVTVLSALMTGCGAAPLPPPTRSTPTLITDVKTKIDDAAATNVKIGKAVDVTVTYLTTWLPAHYPAAATQPATVQAVAAAQAGCQGERGVSVLAKSDVFNAFQIAAAVQRATHAAMVRGSQIEEIS